MALLALCPKSSQLATQHSANPPWLSKTELRFSTSFLMLSNISKNQRWVTRLPTSFSYFDSVDHGPGSNNCLQHGLKTSLLANKHFMDTKCLCRKSLFVSNEKLKAKRSNLIIILTILVGCSKTSKAWKLPVEWVENGLDEVDIFSLRSNHLFRWYVFWYLFGQARRLDPFLV